MENYKDKRGELKQGAGTAGIVYGNVSNASTIHGKEKFHAVRGHGFAAERANTLYDKLTGHDVELVGDSNVPDGADRIVDGINIQSKYCSTGGKCISECFKDGKFRYVNSDGTPMQIEVPFDKYDSAVQAMQERISRGEIEDVTNSEDAKMIVRQGKFTYEQAKNIAKAGTVDSLKYDAANSTIIVTGVFGVTSVLSFAVSIWNGEDIDMVLVSVVYDGLKVSGVTFITAILAGQLTKAGLNSMLVGGKRIYGTCQCISEWQSYLWQYLRSGGDKKHSENTSWEYDNRNCVCCRFVVRRYCRYIPWEDFGKPVSEKCCEYDSNSGWRHGRMGGRLIDSHSSCRKYSRFNDRRCDCQ